MNNPRTLFADMPFAIKEIVPTPSHDIYPDNLLKIRGMRIEFENGRFLSVQAGPSNYASFIEDVQLRVPFTPEELERNPHFGANACYLVWDKDYLKWHENWYNLATSVEIATWSGEFNLQDMPGGDTVMGHVTEEQLVTFVFDLLTADKAAGFPVASPEQALGENWYDEFDLS